MLAIYFFASKYLFSSWTEDITRSTGSDPRYTRIICTIIAGAIFPFIWKMFAGIGLPGDENAIKLGSRGIAVIYSLFLLWQIVEQPDLNFAPEGAKDAKGTITATPVAVKFICRNQKCPNYSRGKEKSEVKRGHKLRCLRKWPSAHHARRGGQFCPPLTTRRCLQENWRHLGRLCWRCEKHPSNA